MELKKLINCALIGIGCVSLTACHDLYVEDGYYDGGYYDDGYYGGHRPPPRHRPPPPRHGPPPHHHGPDYRDLITGDLITVDLSMADLTIAEGLMVE